ncbi:MAG: F0F1 ATP synthase subunit B [Planctomycetes bacterium]|nr:F0F1 ATP synthase subunit B [Planctomycetota bacterium]
MTRESAATGEPGAPLQEKAIDLGSPLTNHLLWEWIAFVLLFVVLAKVGFPWMFKQMDARQARIREALEKADKVKAEAEVLLKKHEQMMADAHAEAKRITDEALRAAQHVKEDILRSAQTEAAAVVERAKKELSMAHTKAMDELRKHAVELSLKASSAVLKRSLTDEDHRRLAADAISATERAMKN